LLDDFDDLSNQKKKEFAGIINESANNIYRLLENLLEWSFAQTGALQINAKNIDLGLLIYDTISLSKSMQENKRIKITQDIQTQRLAFADEDTIRVVLRNLLSNALKFTPKGGRIDFLVEEQKVDGSCDNIVIRVKDFGVGIKHDDIANLFSLKNKFKATGTEKETGTGLGLILCKEFVEKNGGKLFVESEPGKGSTFSFTLPCNKL